MNRLTVLNRIDYTTCILLGGQLIFSFLSNGLHSKTLVSEFYELPQASEMTATGTVGLTCPSKHGIISNQLMMLLYKSCIRFIRDPSLIKKKTLLTFSYHKLMTQIDQLVCPCSNIENNSALSTRALAHEWFNSRA